MNARQNLTLMLILTGLLLVLLPGIGEYSFKVKPGKMVQSVIEGEPLDRKSVV